MFSKLLIANRGEIACRTVTAAVCAILLSATGGAAAHTITNISVIETKLGENRISHFAPDGRAGRIIQAWRGNGNARSYNLFLVLMPGGEMKSDWNVVGIYTGPPHGEFLDTISDAPHTGEDYVRSVRFARATVDGKPATIFLTATRDWTTSIPERSFVDFVVYRLERPDAFGTPDQFDVLERTRSKAMYCNSDLALSKEFSVPLPADYAGPNRKDGCQ